MLLDLDCRFNVVEIFHSLQGEGFNTGMEAVFLRLGKCNLACPWCDTNYNKFNNLSLSEIKLKLDSYSCKNIIITGGEPTVTPKLDLLVNWLKQQGYFVAIETNGLKSVPFAIDYIAASPKFMYRHKYRQQSISYADEVRIVIDKYNEEIFDFCNFIQRKIKAKYYYISPCEVNGEMNILDTIKLLGRLNLRTTNKVKNCWHLSLQTHKFAAIE